MDRHARRRPGELSRDLREARRFRGHPPLSAELVIGGDDRLAMNTERLRQVPRRWQAIARLQPTALDVGDDRVRHLEILFSAPDPRVLEQIATHGGWTTQYQKPGSV
jgi:hypothetical protein